MFLKYISMAKNYPVTLVVADFHLHEATTEENIFATPSKSAATTKGSPSLCILHSVRLKEGMMYSCSFCFNNSKEFDSMNEFEISIL